MPAPASLLDRWDNFYVIVGSSAGALTSVQFVVITLIAQTRVAGNMLQIRAFGTPTVVHFCVVVMVAGLATAPWTALLQFAIALGVAGLGGLIYAINSIGHARRQIGYEPDAEDWFWFFGLPIACYAALVVAALVVNVHAATALFITAAAALLLLFTGIHNAWDTITYITIKNARDSNSDITQATQENESQSSA